MSRLAKIPHKAWALLQIGLRRGLELTEATVREVNAHALIPTIVLVRSLFEVANLMFFTWEKIEAVLSSQSSSDLATLDNDLIVLALGTRSKEWQEKYQEPIQAKNILTIIDRVSKTRKFARDHYDDLSEFA